LALFALFFLHAFALFFLHAFALFFLHAFALFFSSRFRARERKSTKKALVPTSVL
jgi:hypothetical protein